MFPERNRFPNKAKLNAPTISWHVESRVITPPLAFIGRDYGPALRQNDAMDRQYNKRLYAYGECQVSTVEPLAEVIRGCRCRIEKLHSRVYTCDH